jgi:hypothetical protein
MPWREWRSVEEAIRHELRGMQMASSLDSCLPLLGAYVAHPTDGDTADGADGVAYYLAIPCAVAHLGLLCALLNAQLCCVPAHKPCLQDTVTRKSPGLQTCKPPLDADQLPAYHSSVAQQPAVMQLIRLPTSIARL